MQFAGTVPPDAPDPRIEAEARLAAMPFPVVGFRPQPALTRLAPGFTEMRDAAGPGMLSVSLSYTLWRYPDDHVDPRNERDVDERLRRSIEDEPAWGRPAWLREGARVLLYPMLWEAVRTTSQRESRPIEDELADHSNHVLRNQFREELGLPPGPGGGDAWEVRRTAVAASTVVVDGEERPAAGVDTDPFVRAWGFSVDEHTVCTVVVPRDHLGLFDPALVIGRPSPGIGE